ncbi:gamma-butyrobetaine hydroxylase-like domain-containing protein [Neisseria shayeganii]|nr:DUF971 domain-containing protein [Neisseria shayeganii]QMT41007.1 DUF971 domain-containing protein [Neisseria shayeganii]
MSTPLPQEIRLQQQGILVILHYADGEYRLPAEYLRVYSPSAEVRGHGSGQEKLQTGKAGVRIIALQAAGNYALKITFSDGHDSGLYDWDYLYKLAHEYDTMWADYLDRLRLAGASRQADPASTKPQSLQ